MIAPTAQRQTSADQTKSAAQSDTRLRDRNFSGPTFDGGLELTASAMSVRATACELQYNQQNLK
jgi:hypothetical protein